MSEAASYKAEAIEYRMYFGKAHEYQVDWLRNYIIKNNPWLLPENIIPSPEAEKDMQQRIDIIDTYTKWLNSSSRMPSNLKDAIGKAFYLI